MVSKESKRYVAYLVEKLGKIGETTGECFIIIASDDKEALVKAKNWLRENNLQRDGDALELTETGRLVKRMLLRAPGDPKREQRARRSSKKPSGSAALPDS